MELIRSQDGSDGDCGDLFVEHAEMASTYFIACYCGISLPVIGFGNKDGRFDDCGHDFCGRDHRIGCGGVSEASREPAPENFKYLNQRYLGVLIGSNN
jgi:hypothetical protein